MTLMERLGLFALHRLDPERAHFFDKETGMALRRTA